MLEAKFRTLDAAKLEEANDPSSQILKELSHEMAGPRAEVFNRAIESEWFCMTGEY